MTDIAYCRTKACLSSHEVLSTGSLGDSALQQTSPLNTTFQTLKAIGSAGDAVPELFEAPAAACSAVWRGLCLFWDQDLV